jgi:hypothetical protein
MKKNEQLIGEIMLDHLPKNILGALRVMSSLTYPISDRRSFLAQLETLVNDPQDSPPSEQVEALHLVRRAITAFDFPISTPVSGLEKALARLSNRYWDDFGLDLDVPDPGDFVERPVIDDCQELMNKFPGACGQQACAVFEQLVRQHGVFNARVAAEAVGRSCR